ncbi:Cytochrome c oxidase assembly factor 1-like [Oopsacas minuta]|uniref:Cytochrome c oxidase assembly factor 1-like n=1 Tax=Oopsacas minuta TaxID=111878 RepID=A0AAV7K049_9METZ|nr:Cytochrome c oxidase assembly factor 1-like [Oopsacas minuta]
MHRKVQSNITKGIPYQLALKELDSSSNVCKLIGRPISLRQLDLSDKGNRIDYKSAYLKVPFTGSKRSGVIHAVVKKREERWEVIKLSVELEVPMKEGWSHIIIKDFDDAK